VQAKVWTIRAIRRSQGRITAVLRDGDGHRDRADRGRVFPAVRFRSASPDFRASRSGISTIPRSTRSTVTLETAAGADAVTSRFGFRSAEYTAGRLQAEWPVVKLRGLNRHQAWPHLGYAWADGAQEKDAEILKHDLACNIARTSHYPQSKYFLDRCDEIGLLVFEEIPGWQHIGGDSLEGGERSRTCAA
jgi:beta-galactosidase